MSLQTLLQSHGIACDSRILEQLESYSATLLTWNRTHNLSGAKNHKEVWDNLVDSLYPLRFLPEGFLTNLTSCIDIGSGAGFPGIALASALPHVHFHLIEPRKKRASFLYFVALQMKLPNITIHSLRAQECRVDSPDLITSRALTDVSTLISISHHLLSAHTSLLLYKGTKSDKEVKEHDNFNIIAQLGARRYLFKKGNQHG